MACSICRSTEANDRRNAAAVPLAGAMVDRVRRALAITDDARCFAGTPPRMCSRCVSNIEAIESALTLRGKMRQLLDLPASDSVPQMHPPAGVATTEACAVATAGCGTRLDAGSNAVADRRARSPGRAVHDARAEPPAVVTEADSSSSVQLTDDGLPVAGRKSLQSGDDKEKWHSGTSAGEISAPSPTITNHASAASAVVTVKVDPVGTDIAGNRDAGNRDAGIVCTVNLPRKEPAVKVELGESGSGRSNGEGTPFEHERQRSAVSAASTPSAAGRDVNGSTIMGRSGAAALAPPPERLLRSATAAAVAGVASTPLDTPIALHQLQPLSRKAARSSSSSHIPAVTVGDGSLPTLVAAAAAAVGNSWSSSGRGSTTIGSGGRRRPLSRPGGGGSSVPALVVCRHCGKGFNSYSVLRVHLRSHTGEKPFTCRHCGVGFTQSQHARSHERRVHERTDGKQFRCSTCNAAYWRLGMLKAHERIHTAGAVATASQQQQHRHPHQLPPEGASPSVRSGAPQVHRSGRVGGRSSGSVTTAAPVAVPHGLAATMSTPPHGAARSSGRKRAASAVQRRPADTRHATYRSSVAADRMDDAWYHEASSNDGFDSDDELACGSNGGIGNSGGCGDGDSLGRGAVSMMANQSKRYCCDQCDDAFWKIGHLLRHKTLVHSSVDGVTADGSAEPQSVFGDHSESIGETAVDAASASTSSSAAHRASDLADPLGESSGDELDSSRATDAAVLLSDGDVAAAGVALPVACPQQVSSVLTLGGGGRKPRKRLKTVQSLTNYVDDAHAAAASVLPAPGGIDDPSSKPTSQDETDITFQSSSVFPRGDHDWAELSGISLSSVAGQTSAAVASPVLDGTLSQSALSSPMPIDDWGLKCTECNEQFPFKLGLQRHIRTVHVRKNQYACGVCTASFMLEKTLKHHVENAHPGLCDGAVDEAGASPLQTSVDVAPIIDGKRFVMERDIRGSGSNSLTAGRQEGRASSAAVARPVASVTVTAVDRPVNALRRADASVRSASTDVASDAASPASALHGARPDVGMGGTVSDGFGYRCKECSSTFRSKAVLRAHVRVHQASDEFPYGCDVCGARFMAEKYLTQHAVVHGEKQFECKVCRLRFSRRASLVQHVTCSHAGQCDYACDSCTATFNNPTALTKHKHRMHSDDHYDTASAVASAAATESGDVPGSPSLLRPQQLGTSLSSGRSGSPEAQLARSHRLQSQPSGGAVCQAAAQEGTGGVVYPPARFFECETCRSSFGSLSALSLHKHRVHGVLTPRSAARASAGAGAMSATDSERNSSGVARLTSARSAVASSAAVGGGSSGGNSHLHCHLCNRKFSSMSSRAAHMRLHTGERPYACTVCGRRFVQSVHLKSHMRLHTGEKPYVCGVCGMAHRHRSGFMKHMRNHHGAPAVEMSDATPLGRSSRRASLGRTRTESASAAIIGRATTGTPTTRGSSSSLLDGVSESQSDLSRDFADERDSCGDSIADGDGTRRSESSASTLPPGGDATDVGDYVCDTCHEILPSATALSAHTATMHESRVVVRDVGGSGAQKSFSCSKCGERFGLKFLLKQHMKNRHRLVMAE